MAKPEWGAKRICHSCGTRYYDMQRDPVICPKCGTEFDPEAFLKSRRSRAPLPEDAAPAKSRARDARSEDEEEEKLPGDAEDDAEDTEEGEDLVDDSDVVDDGDEDDEDDETPKKKGGYDEDVEDLDEEEDDVLIEDADELDDTDVDEVVEIEKDDDEQSR